MLCATQSLSSRGCGAVNATERSPCNITYSFSISYELKMRRSGLLGSVLAGWICISRRSSPRSRTKRFRGGLFAGEGSCIGPCRILLAIYDPERPLVFRPCLYTVRPNSRGREKNVRDWFCTGVVAALYEIDC